MNNEKCCFMYNDVNQCLKQATQVIYTKDGDPSTSLAVCDQHLLELKQTEDVVYPIEVDG